METSRIPYMITGSIASSLQGSPRATHDIDIVITIESNQVDRLLRFFPKSEYYSNIESIHQAIRKQDMFNIIHSREGLKIDFWLLTDDLFDQSRFSRRYQDTYSGIQLHISRPEDTILAKLRWARLSGGSEKHFMDAIRVYEVQFNNLDIPYMEKWVKQFEIGTLWDRLRNEARTSEG